jgi:hypothetical protein
MWIEKIGRLDVDRGEWREWMWIKGMERMDVDRGDGEIRSG